MAEASLTPTGALTDAELDRVRFRLGYEKTGATPDFQADPDSHDTITGGAGADTITVTGGNDRLLYVSTGDVLDSIIGFDNNPAGGGQDLVDLDALFDSLGVAAASRAGRVQLVDTGPDVRVNIDADGGGNGFELTLLTFQAMASPTGLTVGTAAADDIQVGS